MKENNPVRNPAKYKEKKAFENISKKVLFSYYIREMITQQPM